MQIGLDRLAFLLPKSARRSQFIDPKINLAYSISLGDGAWELGQAKYVNLFGRVLRSFFVLQFKINRIEIKEIMQFRLQLSISNSYRPRLWSMNRREQQKIVRNLKRN